jgi:hypothetical protein
VESAGPFLAISAHEFRCNIVCKETPAASMRKDDRRSHCSEKRSEKWACEIFLYTLTALPGVT